MQSKQQDSLSEAPNTLSKTKKKKRKQISPIQSLLFSDIGLSDRLFFAFSLCYIAILVVCDKQAFNDRLLLFAFIKACPIWVASINCLISQDQSTMGMGFIFSAAGDLAMDIESYDQLTPKDSQLIFKIGVCLFGIQHLCISINLLNQFRSFYVNITIVILASLISLMYYIISVLKDNPDMDGNLISVVIIYSGLLILNCCLSIYTLPRHDGKSEVNNSSDSDGRLTQNKDVMLDYEWLNVLGAFVFSLSDTILIMGKVQVLGNPDNPAYLLQSAIQVKILVMITYYSAQYFYMRSTIKLTSSIHKRD